MTNNNRRGFLRHAAVLGALPVVAADAATATATQKIKQDYVMLVWLAHSMFHPASKGRPADEAFIADIMAKCANHGFTTVYIQPRYVGKAVYHSKVVAAFDSMYTAEGPTLTEALRRFDPYDVAVREAKRCGLKVMAQISIFDLWFPGLEDRFYEKNPQYLMVDRKGQRLYYQGVPCYAEKGAQDYCLAEIRELLERGAEGIAFEMDSHQMGWWPPGFGSPEADSFGFNPPWSKNFSGVMA